MSVLEIKEVQKSFGKNCILNGLSLNCETGKIYGLLGRNGSGKSTFFKTILGTVKAESIQIAIDRRVYSPSEVIPSKKIGYLPQESFLPKETKVRDVIPLIFPKGEEQDKIFYSQGVAQFDHLKIGKLSAGQLKYLEVLLLCHLKHPFLLLDEPFSMVEPQFIEKIKELLQVIKGSKGLMVTDHYYRDVLEISNKCFVLKNGKLFEIEGEQDLATHEYSKNRNR